MTGLAVHLAIVPTTIVYLSCFPYYVTWLQANHLRCNSHLRWKQATEKGQADKACILAPARPALQALPKKFPFWLYTVHPYIIQS